MMEDRGRGLRTPVRRARSVRSERRLAYHVIRPDLRLFASRYAHYEHNLTFNEVARTYNCELQMSLSLPGAEVAN